MSGIQYDGMVVNTMPSSSANRDCENRGERRFHWQSALLLETVRRLTFTDWNVPFMDPDKLAESGFFYLRTEDHVQCVFCQGIVGYWDQGDDPKVEHSKHFPNCPLITGAATGNVPRVGNDNPSTTLYRFLDEYHTFRVSSTKPKPLKSAYQTDCVLLSDSGQLAYPQYNTTGNRIQTYSRWPKGTGVSPEVLAEAGFFSTGLADWVQCFHCGGGLYGWRFGDTPIKDHARFFPYCPFARGKMGEENVNKYILENPSPQSNSRPVTISADEAELLLHHPIAKRLLAMGLSRESVKGALKGRLETRGVLCRTVTEALELVFDYEERQRKNNNINTLCHDGPQMLSEGVSIAPVPASLTRQSSTSFCPGPSIQGNQNSFRESEHTRLLREIEALRQQVLIAERRLMCRICGKARVAVAFQPCSHFHLCAECARPRDTCTSCGAIVRGTLRPIVG